MNLSPLISRILAIILAFGVVWLVIAIFVLPLAEQISEDSQKTDQDRKLIARYEQLSAMEPQLRQQLDQVRAYEESRRDMYDASKGALAAAEMQNQIQQITATSGAVLRSSRPLPKQVEDGFDRIGWEVELVGTTENLQRVLYGIETAVPATFIERLSITTSEATGRPGQDNSSPLTIRLSVFAYARGTPS